VRPELIVESNYLAESFARLPDDAGNDLLATRCDSELGGNYGIGPTSLCKWIEPARAEHG
jgi:hypothetical protein